MLYQSNWADFDQRLASWSFSLKMIFTVDVSWGVKIWNCWRKETQIEIMYEYCKEVESINSVNTENGVHLTFAANLKYFTCLVGTSSQSDGPTMKTRRLSVHVVFCQWADGCCKYTTVCVCVEDIKEIYTSVFLTHLASWEMTLMTLDREGGGGHMTLTEQIKINTTYICTSISVRTLGDKMHFLAPVLKIQPTHQHVRLKLTEHAPTQNKIKVVWEHFTDMFCISLPFINISSLWQ